MNTSISFAVLLIFTIAHVLSHWAQHREDSKAVGAKPANLFGYIRHHAPAKTPLAILSSVGLGLVLWEQGTLSTLTALTAGWASSSMVGKLSDMGKKIL